MNINLDQILYNFHGSNPNNCMLKPLNTKGSKSKIVAEDIIKNFGDRVLLAIFILATYAYTQTHFKGFKPQIFLLVNAASSSN